MYRRRWSWKIRLRAGCTSWGGYDPSTSARSSCGCSTSPWSPALFPRLWCAGAGARQRQSFPGRKSWESGPDQWSAWSWTLWWQWQRGELSTNCGAFWTMPATLCTLSSAAGGAGSATGCSFQRAGQTDWKTPFSPRVIKLFNSSVGGRRVNRWTAEQRDWQTFTFTLTFTITMCNNITFTDTVYLCTVYIYCIHTYIYLFLFLQCFFIFIYLYVYLFYCICV